MIGLNAQDARVVLTSRVSMNTRQVYITDCAKEGGRLQGR